MRPEETELLARPRRASVSPVVASECRVAGTGQSSGEAHVSARMLGQAMRDLHHALGRGFGQPAIDEESDAVRGAESKGGALHVLRRNLRRKMRPVRGGRSDRPLASPAGGGRGYRACALLFGGRLLSERRCWLG